MEQILLATTPLRRSAYKNLEVHDFHAYVFTNCKRQRFENHFAEYTNLTQIYGQRHVTHSNKAIKYYVQI